MGIIRNLKALYRKSMICRIITHIDCGSSVTVTELSRKVTLLDALHMLKVAWDNVKRESDANCFAKAGFVTPVTPGEQESLGPPDGLTCSEFESYVDMDKTLECVGELTDEDICGHILNAEGDTTHTQQESEDEEDESGTDPVTNQREALQAMRVVTLYLEKCGTEMHQFYELEGQLLYLATTRCSQTKGPHTLGNIVARNSPQQWPTTMLFRVWPNVALLHVADE